MQVVKDIKNVIYRFPSNLFLRLKKMRNFAEFIFAIGEFGNICGTNFCDLGPKSQKFVPQKLMPQHFMPAKINTLLALITPALIGVNFGLLALLGPA